MGSGYLKIQVRTSGGALPIEGAHVVVKTTDNEPLFETYTDESGLTESLSLTAPDRKFTLDPNYKKPAYSMWDVDISHKGFITSHIHDVEIIEGETSVLPVELYALVDETDHQTDLDINIPPNHLLLPEEHTQIPHQEDRKRQAVPVAFMPANAHAIPFVAREVFIPDFITVHLGAPTNASARNTRVPFIDYIKNVTYRKYRTVQRQS